MKTVRLALRHTADTIHPMHRFVAENESFDSYRMVHGNFVGDDPCAFVFHVVGDPDAYERALESVGDTNSYDISITSERSFTVYVRDEPDEVGQGLLSAFSRDSLVPLPPLEYRSDWTVRFSVVGESADIRRAVDAVPDGIETTVERVGEYGARESAVAALTERQHDAVRLACELGYYDVPRTAGVDAVADRLGVAPATAAEHLRKAESTLVAELGL
ncbi:helix-turn-helix domain-containing protein [Halobacteria archaeon AArc-dxtr1]|nr:helix-turn-helix domain-containing protein [Halobacteria archaeon AArc-dxtr1]